MAGVWSEDSNVEEEKSEEGERSDDTEKFEQGHQPASDTVESEASPRTGDDTAGQSEKVLQT